MSQQNEEQLLKRKQKLSTIEHIVDANIVCYIRLEGSFSLEQFRSALSRVQRKHPALRALIRKEPDGLYFEADSAPEIPLRVSRRENDDDYRRERHIELTTEFSDRQPQLRAVWLQSERENDLLFTTSHRVCDAMSMFTIVKEVLHCIYSNEELVSYEYVTTEDIIGDYQPSPSLRRTLAVHLVNGLLRLIPSSVVDEDELPEPTPSPTPSPSAASSAATESPVISRTSRSRRWARTARSSFT